MVLSLQSSSSNHQHFDCTHAHTHTRALSIVFTKKGSANNDASFAKFVCEFASEIIMRARFAVVYFYDFKCRL